MSVWHRVAKVSDLSDGAGQVVDISGESIALFNMKGKFYAIANHCPHRGGPLAEGHVEDGVVTCSWHGWEFEIKSGKCRTMPGSKQRSYPTKIENNEILINI